MKRELNLISKIPDERLSREVEETYRKINGKIGNSKKLTLVGKFSDEGCKSERSKETIFHEFIHELLEENNIRPKSWKWNEGLVTYIAYNFLGKLHRVKERQKLKQSEMWYIYADYTRRWINLLEGTENPKERKRIILEKVMDIDKTE